MAKRKQSAAGTAAENRTKKLKPVSKRKMQNEAKAKNGPGNGVTIERKNASKPRSSPKPTRASASRTTTSTSRTTTSTTRPSASRTTTSTSRTTTSTTRPSASRTTTSTTSKYFTSPLKAQPKTSDDDDDDDEDDFDMVPMATPTNQEDDDEEEESEEDDWEEVEELDGPLGPVGPETELVLPSHPIEIEIETPDLVHKRQKREKRKAEWETYLRRVVNRFNKDLLIDTHKVHLLCLIANGMCRNRLCNEPDLLAITLSLLPVHFSNVAKERIDNLYLSGLLKWFVATFTLNPSLAYEEHPDPRGLLERRLASLSARDHREMTHLFLLVLRSLQLFCRLVISLQPIPLKPPPARGKGASSSSSAPGESNPPGQTAPKDGTTPSEPRASRGTKRPAGGKAKGERGGKKAKRKNIKEEEDEEEVGGGRSATTGGQKPKNAKRRSVASKVSYKEESESDGREGWLSEAGSAEEFQLSSAKESDDSEGGAKSQKGKKGKGKTKAKTNYTTPQNKSLKGKKGKGKSKAKAQNKSQRGKGKSKANTTTPQSKSGGCASKKVTNKQEDDKWEEVADDKRGGGGGRVMINKGFTRKSGGLKIRGPGADEWLEVYVPKTSSWVCVDVQQGIGRPHLCPQNATAPVTYVVSVDGHGHLKDLGRKYDPTWMTSSKKRRVEEDWWEDTLRPFLGPELERDRQEDKELNTKMIDKPLPTGIAEYKNHPLYCLKRHMLKYEALYPPTAAVLGYCRGEPVYSRYCVHTMHSKDTWLKEARTVRLGEQPYKMVKGFSNRSRKARIVSEQREEKDLPLFGEWQTEEYQPPIAIDGKVPRNDYGNVYLFKPCMLPLGCVHLRLPSLHRVAKKLDMDAAPAITGFDFHGGFSHAVTDGYVVCEENEEILRAAWSEDQEIQKKKEEEKREKRVISNWTLLVKGLLIRERLQRRYGYKKNQGPGGAGTSSQTHTPAGDGADGLLSDDDDEEVEGGGPAIKTAAETLAMAWPQNRQEEEDMNANVPTKKTTKREKKGQEKHLFPFEKV